MLSPSNVKIARYDAEMAPDRERCPCRQFLRLKELMRLSQMAHRSGHCSHCRCERFSCPKVPRGSDRSRRSRLPNNWDVGTNVIPRGVTGSLAAVCGRFSRLRHRRYCSRGCRSLTTTSPIHFIMNLIA